MSGAFGSLVPHPLVPYDILRKCNVKRFVFECCCNFLDVDKHVVDLKKVESLLLVLTSECNCRCSYCYQNDRKPLRMNWRTLRAALDMALQHCLPKLEIIFSGGEPLLVFPAVQRAVEYVKAKCPQQEGPKFSLCTNGLLLTPPIVAFLEEHHFEVQLSFDGVAGAQDLRKEGTSTQIAELLRALRRDCPELFHKRLIISQTLVPTTILHLNDSLNHMLDNGVQQIALAPSITHHPSWTEKDMELLDAKFSQICETSIRHFRETDRIPLLLFRWGGEGAPRQRADGEMCRVMHGKKLVVDVQGQIHGCALFAESYQEFPSSFLKNRLRPLGMGDIRNPRLLDRYLAFPAAVRKAEIFHHKEAKYSAHGKCKECDILESCSICPVSIGYNPENHDPNRVPDFHCAFNRIASKYHRYFFQRVLFDPMERLRFRKQEQSAPNM
jgi:sulfatase maturation enzyme AslB (radical SAM superfamily)